MAAALPLLKIRNLSTSFQGSDGVIEAVRDVSVDLHRGETFAIVGESGSGKSVTALSILQLLPYPRAFHPSGEIWLEGVNLMTCNERALRRVRGARIAMIFQEPMNSLNPLHTIGRQISETILLHGSENPSKVRAHVRELLDLVGLAGLRERLSAYPHELSGGQRQRVMIAMALANRPDILIADEPTTALDVTVQAQILTLLKELQATFGMTILLITHDLTMVRRVADRVGVMYQGKLVETGMVKHIMARPKHAYTRHLLASEPKGVPVKINPRSPFLMETRNLKVYFPVKEGMLSRTWSYVKAVDGISLAIREGHTLGLVGESGSGKSTLALAMLRLIASEGDILYGKRPLNQRKYHAIRPLRRDIQFVFQDPFGSLNPRLTVEQILREGLIAHSIGNRGEQDSAIDTALKEVGLEPAMRRRYPHEFSGGQRQRISIARALILKPRFIALDEPTSALDLSTQAEILDLLKRLQRKHRLTYLFISHDLRVIRAIAHDIIVMRDGRIIEQGRRSAIFGKPREEYTKALLSAAIGDT